MGEYSQDCYGFLKTIPARMLPCISEPSALIREFIAVFVSRRFFPWAVLDYLLFISPIVVALIRQRRLTHDDRSC